MEHEQLERVTVRTKAMAYCVDITQRRDTQ